MRKKRVKISKSDKILLIVENSEEEFFNGYFKEYLLLMTWRKYNQK